MAHGILTGASYLADHEVFFNRGADDHPQYRDVSFLNTGATPIARMPSGADTWSATPTISGALTAQGGITVGGTLKPARRLAFRHAISVSPSGETLEAAGATLLYVNPGAAIDTYHTISGGDTGQILFIFNTDTVQDLILDDDTAGNIQTRWNIEDGRGSTLHYDGTVWRVLGDID